MEKTSRPKIELDLPFVTGNYISKFENNPLNGFKLLQGNADFVEFSR